MTEAFATFLKRTRRLSQLYDFSAHSYATVADSLRSRIKNGELQPRSHISLHGFVDHHHVDALMQFAQRLFPSDLRAVVLTRLITDFEVFLVSEIREIASRTEAIFQREKPLGWLRERLNQFSDLEELRDTLLDDDCRGITSGGFDEACKFYQRHLSIQIAPPGQPLAQLRELHARRHLHIHRAGVVDPQYLHDFGAMSPQARLGSVLEVDDPYLRKAFLLLRSTARHVTTAGAVTHPTKSAVRIGGRARSMSATEGFYLVRARFRAEEDRQRYFELDRALESRKGNSPITFGEVLAQAECDGLRARWTIIAGGENREHFFRDLSVNRLRETMSRVTYSRLTPSP